MTPEQLVERLRRALPSGLRSVVLYGSAAAGDHVAGRSDYNVLVVADRLGMEELNALAEPAAAWARAGNRPPLLFTAAQLCRSADAFPIELSDMQQSRKVLFGSDDLAGIAVDHEHLRMELERELKSNLLTLRERYLVTRGKPRQVRDLVTSSLSTFLVLIRASLRLWQPDVPARKAEAVRILARHIGFDPQPFLTAAELRAGRLKPRAVPAGPLFASYLEAVEQVVEAVDRRIRDA